ncbi:MAG: translation elongation factor Ts [Candidatus Eremiobacteraeota bacterium]|nr:translation elongation factor Ts [Candidatus Eremiobacteraeota bacterium]
MQITAKQVKELRDETGAGMMDCKKALKKAEGDLEKAKKVLREDGIAKAEKKTDRATNNGRIESYIHMGGRIGVLIQLNCETDFVAGTDDFKNLVKELAMQVAASSPDYVSSEDIPTEVVEKEREILKNMTLKEGKPEKIVDKIVDGRINKFFEQICLLEQPYIRDDKQTVRELVKQVVAKVGENIKVVRFARFSLGD